MKRLGAIGIVAFTALLASHGASRAQTTPASTPTATVTPTPSATATPGSTPTPTATAPPVQLLSPAAFALSAWYFPPPASMLAAQVETNDMAAAEPLILHLSKQSFAAEGRVSGYFADSGVRNMDSKGVDHPVFTRYLVSMFPSVAQAATAFTQQRDGWDGAINDPTSPINGQLDPVSLQVGDQMSKGVYVAKLQSSAGAATLSELLFQRGPYFIEVWQEGLQKDVTAYSSTDRPFLLSLAKTLDTIASGQRVPALPKPAVKLHLESVRFEANKTQHGLAIAPLKSIKTGSQVELGSYFVLTSAPARSQVKGDFWLTLGKRKLHKTYKHTLGTYPPNYYHDFVYDVRLPRAGTYHLKVAITIGKVLASGTASLKVSASGRLALSARSSAIEGAEGSVMIQPTRDVLRDDAVPGLKGMVRGRGAG